jgi:hypothetical protein
LGVLLSGKEDIQVQLKVTNLPDEVFSRGWDAYFEIESTQDWIGSSEI